MSIRYLDVRSNNGNIVKAKTLVDFNGSDIINPATGSAYIVPLDYDLQREIDFGRGLYDQLGSAPESLGAVLVTFALNVFRGGPHDIQRSYNGTVGGGGPEFVPAFTDVASFTYGLIGRVAGFGLDLLMASGGLYNLVSGGHDVSGAYYLNSAVDEDVKAGSDFYQTGKDSHGIALKQFCFAAGTLVKTRGGTTSIENISEGDVVFGFDPWDGPEGQLYERAVVRTFKSTALEIIEFHGTKVTPGHLYYCADKRFRPIYDILASDGSVVAESGISVRARTNRPLESEDDREIPVYIVSENAIVNIRAGVPYGRTGGSEEVYTLSAKMGCNGFILRSDGLFENSAGDVRMAAWEWGDPRQHPVARNYIVGAPYDLAEFEILN